MIENTRPEMIARTTTTRDQQDAVERQQSRSDQIDARRQLRDGDRRIDRLRQEIERYV